MRVNKWYMIPALLVGAGLGRILFYSTDVDPVTVVAVAVVLAILSGALAKMAER